MSSIDLLTVSSSSGKLTVLLGSKSIPEKIVSIANISTVSIRSREAIGDGRSKPKIVANIIPAATTCTLKATIPKGFGRKPSLDENSVTRARVSEHDGYIAEGEIGVSRVELVCYWASGYGDIGLVDTNNIKDSIT